MKDTYTRFIEWIKRLFDKEMWIALFSDKKKRGRFIAICSALVITLATVIGCAVYVSDYYRADEEAVAALDSVEGVEVKEIGKGVIAFKPEGEVKAGFIFYPGGKVEYTSYAPLMLELASDGILAVLVEMPCNLAVLDVNAAKGIPEKFPEVDSWYIGGHSLGGSMAASYMAKNPEIIDGLVLLGSYSTADVTDFRVLSIYGDMDGVMNREKYKKYKTNLPEGFTEEIIEGGNHAGFGMYGEQEGDGDAKISAEDQISVTADYIVNFIAKE